jgi:hypothetical protein
MVATSAVVDPLFLLLVLALIFPGGGHAYAKK